MIVDQDSCHKHLHLAPRSIITCFFRSPERFWIGINFRRIYFHNASVDLLFFKKKWDEMPRDGRRLCLKNTNFLWVLQWQRRNFFPSSSTTHDPHNRQFASDFSRLYLIDKTIRLRKIALPSGVVTQNLIKAALSSSENITIHTESGSKWKENIKRSGCALNPQVCEQAN